MSTQNTFHCIVDDTTLTTNLDEIAPWVQAGTVQLVVPLYTLERLNLLKKDASALGQSARKAVKFLDQSDDLPHTPVVIQGPDDQYKKWEEVEKRYVSSVIRRDDSGAVIDGDHKEQEQSTENRVTTLDKQLHDLSLSSEDIKTSPLSTPPLSPTSEPQSTKTSPEVRNATIALHEATPVPPTLKPLMNYVVWYTYDAKHDSDGKNLIFLTNSADAAQIAKDFGITPKTIHQLRASISAELEGPETSAQPQRKSKANGTRPTSLHAESVPLRSFDTMRSPAKTKNSYSSPGQRSQQDLCHPAEEWPTIACEGGLLYIHLQIRSTPHRVRNLRFLLKK